MTQKKERKINNGGFVLLFTLLISSILLATGLGISRLMVRQIALASLSRESQVAFFAADSGIECALHFERSNKFAVLADQSKLKPEEIICNGKKIKSGAPSVLVATNTVCDATGEPPRDNVINGQPKSCFTFSLSINDNLTDKPCVFVVVDKTAGSQTRITSNGYNKCNLNSANVLQRTLEFTLRSP